MSDARSSAHVSSRSVRSASAVGRLRRGRLLLVLVGALVGAAGTLLGLARIDRSSIAAAAIVGLTVVVAAPVATRWIRSRRFPLMLGVVAAILAGVGDRVLSDDTVSGATPVVLWATAILVAAGFQWRSIAVDGSPSIAPTAGPAAVAIVVSIVGGIALAADGLSSMALTVAHGAPLACVLFAAGQHVVSRSSRNYLAVVGALSGLVAASAASVSGHEPDLGTNVGVAAAAAVALLVLLAAVDGVTVAAIAVIALLVATRATGSMALLTVASGAAFAGAVVYGLEPSLRVATRRRAHRRLGLHDGEAADEQPAPTAEIDWAVLDADVEHATADVDWSIVDKDLGDIVEGVDDTSASSDAATGHAVAPADRAPIDTARDGHSSDVVHLDAVRAANGRRADRHDDADDTSEIDDESAPPDGDAVDEMAQSRQNNRPRNRRHA